MLQCLRWFGSFWVSRESDWSFLFKNLSDSVVLLDLELRPRFPKNSPKNDLHEIWDFQDQRQIHATSKWVQNCWPDRGRSRTPARGNDGVPQGLGYGRMQQLTQVISGWRFTKATMELTNLRIYIYDYTSIPRWYIFCSIKTAYFGIFKRILSLSCPLKLDTTSSQRVGSHGGMAAAQTPRRPCRGLVLTYPNPREVCQKNHPRFTGKG